MKHVNKPTRWILKNLTNAPGVSLYSQGSRRVLLLLQEAIPPTAASSFKQVVGLESCSLSRVCLTTERIQHVGVRTVRSVHFYMYIKNQEQKNTKEPGLREENTFPAETDVERREMKSEPSASPALQQDEEVCFICCFSPVTSAVQSFILSLCVLHREDWEARRGRVSSITVCVRDGGRLGRYSVHCVNSQN